MNQFALNIVIKIIIPLECKYSRDKGHLSNEG